MIISDIDFDYDLTTSEFKKMEFHFRIVQSSDIKKKIISCLERLENRIDACYNNLEKEPVGSVGRYRMEKGYRYSHNEPDSRLNQVVLKYIITQDKNITPSSVQIQLSCHDDNQKRLLSLYDSIKNMQNISATIDNVVTHAKISALRNGKDPEDYFLGDLNKEY